MIQSRVGWGICGEGGVGWVILGKSLLGAVGWCGVRGVCRQYQYALGKQPLLFF